VPPLISVIVPIYNVEGYLEPCLESLAEQWHSNLEVIMVDDGSTDRSVEIAEAFAAKDDRFRLVRQENAGLGAARNTGLEHVTGEYLAFVDSDDAVPRHAYDVLCHSLEESGSDFAAGDVRRLTSFGTKPAPYLGDAFKRTRVGTHVTKFPALLADTTAWNKLFRRSFWERHGFRFPEGVVYEDIPVTLPAHYLAHAVDVLASTVYLWRLREGDDLSITQRRSEVKSVRDRFAAVNSVSSFLAEHGPRGAKARYDRRVVAYDLRYFLDVLDTADEEYRRVFLHLAAEFLRRAHRSAFDQPLAIERLKWELVRREALPELLEVLRFQDEEMADTPPIRIGRHWYGDYPYLDDARLAIPRRVFRLRTELAASAFIERLAWEGDALRIYGSAYLTRIGAPAQGFQHLRFVLRKAGSLRSTRLQVEELRRPELTADAAGLVDLEWAGFVATLPAEALRRGGRWSTGTWELEAVVRVGGIARSTIRFKAAPFHPPPSAEASLGGAHLRAGTTPEDGFAVRVQTRRSVVRDCTFEAGTLQLAGDIGTFVDGLSLVASRRVGGAALTYPVHVDRAREGDAFLTRVPVVDLMREVDVGDEAAHSEDAEGITWDLELVVNGWRERLALGDEVPEQRWPRAGRELAIHRTRFGNMSIIERSSRPLVTEARWWEDGTMLALAGVFRADAGDYELALSDRAGPERHAYPLRRDGDRFEVDLAPFALEGGGGRLLGSGVWEFLVVRTDGRQRAVPVIEHELLETLPLDARHDHRRLRLGVVGYETPVLQVSRDLDDDERGKANQYRLQTTFYGAQRRAEIRPAVLYESYRGRDAWDSPRSIHEELVRRGTELEHLWVVQDGACEPPPGATPVRRSSRAYYEAVARSRYVVSNDYWPRWADRRPGQVWLQTWHGVPLKLYGSELAARPRALRQHRRALAQRPENWDRVLSSSPFATGVLERSFAIGGAVAETGLPRTDALVAPDAETRRSEVRDRLGLDPDTTAVLYAPTYRDNLMGRDSYRLSAAADLPRLADGLGAGHVVLFRRHPLVGEQPEGIDGAAVRDVFGHPDPMELLLAVDVLVTDYSSFAAEFAVLDRPIVLFVPDLDAYRDDIRGLALDLEREAPGPLVQTTDDLIVALLDPALGHAHSTARDRFRATYLPLADGRAAVRAVDVLLA